MLYCVLGQLLVLLHQFGHKAKSILKSRRVFADMRCDDVLQIRGLSRLEGFEEWEARYREVETQMTEIWTRGVAEGRDEEDIMDDYERALEDAGL